jgi:hypothetical protein
MIYDIGLDTWACTSCSQGLDSDLMAKAPRIEQRAVYRGGVIVGFEDVPLDDPEDDPEEESCL